MINGPDGFTGAVMAIESIPGAVALIHGPGGCRVRNALLSMALVPHEGRRWVEYSEPYYAGYARVPATYIDGDDYIGGAVGRLENALDHIREDGPGLVVLIDSPGASLMADNHMGAVRDLGYSDDVMVLDHPVMSVPVRTSYDRTISEVIGHVCRGRGEVREGTVLILGLTVLDAGWQDVLDEFSSYLEDMGLEVLSSPGAMASVDQLSGCAQAQFAVCICPESCPRTSDTLEGMGVRIVRSEDSPVGFEATRRWIEDVAEATGRDPGKALSRLSVREERAKMRIDGMRYGMMRVSGMTFSASAPGSVLRPLSKWLSGSFGMVPLSMIDEESQDRQRRMEDSDLVLCDGNTALRMTCGRRCSAALSTGFAVIGSDRMVPHPVFGLQGALSVLDAVVLASRSG